MERLRGFTLIEVLSVISILAILGVGTITAFRAAKRSALRQQAIVESAEIAHALLEYRTRYGMWPIQDTVVERDDSTAIVAGVPATDDPDYGLNEVDVKMADVLYAMSPAPADDLFTPGNWRNVGFLELPARCFRKTTNGGQLEETEYPLDPWGRPYVAVMASSKKNDGKQSRTVSHVEGGVYAPNIKTRNDSYTIDSPEDVVVFSWGDPLMQTNSTAPSRVIGSWSK